MPIDPKLLKQAKVYMNKEGEEASAIGPGTGAAIGGIGGAGAGAVGGYLYDQHKKKKKTTKAAKVYDAAESVTDMPVKHVRESHKQCSPGEFGMNKEGKSLQALVAELAKQAESPSSRAKQHGQEHELSIYNNSDYRNYMRGRQPAPGFEYLDRPYLDPAIRNREEHSRRLGGTYPNDEVFPGGAAIDKAVRGYQPDQAYDFQNALADANFEALQHSDIAKAPLPGLLGAAIKAPAQYAAAQRYAGAQSNAAASRQQYNEYMQGEGRGKYPFIQQQIPESAVPAPMGKRFPFSGAVDKIEKAVGRGMRPYEQKLQGPADLQKLYNQLPKLPRRPFVDDANPAAPATGVTKKSAWIFGAQVKQALHPALGMAGLGGAGGLVAGGLSGLIAPGEYEDEDGNVKRRSRLSTALQRALTLGAVGAAGGGAYGMYDQAGAGKAVDFARSLYQQLMGGKKELPAMRYNEDDPGVRAALDSESRYGSLTGNSTQVGGPRGKATPTTGATLPDTKLPGTGSAGKKPSLGPVADLMDNDKKPGTHTPTDEKHDQRRSVDARQSNTMTFPYGKKIDPLTGEKAVPFNMQR